MTYFLTCHSSPEASWHTDYRDTAYIYIGGLPYELSEGDVITIFSQYGEPTYINLIRDKETGKSKGFAFLKYEDQRSTDLAVDNLGGTVVMGKTLKVDHTRYKKKDDQPDEGIDLTNPPKQIEDDNGEGPRKRRRTSESESEAERPMIKEERELAKLIQEHDEDDPMKAYLIEEKREEVSQALARLKPSKSSKSKHRHHHRSRREKENGKDGKEGHRSSRHHRDGQKSRRSRSRDRSPRESTWRREKSPGRAPKDAGDSRPRRRSPSPGGDRRERDNRRRENERPRRSRSRDGSVEKSRNSRRAHD